MVKTASRTFNNAEWAGYVSVSKYLSEGDAEKTRRTKRRRQVIVNETAPSGSMHGSPVEYMCVIQNNITSGGPRPHNTAHTHTHTQKCVVAHSRSASLTMILNPPQTHLHFTSGAERPPKRKSRSEERALLRVRAHPRMHRKPQPQPRTPAYALLSCGKFDRLLPSPNWHTYIAREQLALR